MGRGIIRDERGVALILSLLVLLLLSGIVLAAISIGGSEPQTARNLSDNVRARYLAEAGVHWAYNTLAASPDWNTQLANGGVMAANMSLPGLAAGQGTFSVTARNDIQAGDPTITGVARDGSNSATSDTNGVIILTTTGEISGARRSVQVVLRRMRLPPTPGAISLPGVQTDTAFPAGKDSFDIDGRDYNRDGTLGPAALKYGIQVPPGGALLISFEKQVEDSLSGGAKDSVKGKAQDDPALYDKGDRVIAPDTSLSPGVLSPFLAELAAHPRTRVLKSTQACPMALTATADPTRPRLTNGCSTDQTLYLGTPADPQLIYFRGDLDPLSLFTGLAMNGTISGAGILVVEDGDFRNYGNLRWDGMIVVTGQYVGAGLMAGSQTTIYGSLIIMETAGAEAKGFNELYVAGARTTIRASSQNTNAVQTMRSLTTMSAWREF
jgi:Tfp pilus assembly protein PilX